MVDQKEPKLTAQQLFDNEILDAAMTADLEDKTAAQAIVKSAKTLSVETLTPTIAAVLFVEWNKHNRDFSLPKAKYYAAAMARGEWKLIHQGLAFYSDNNIADGQHRIAAVFLSKSTQDFTVFRNFATDAMQAIDVGKRRTAGDALELGGFENGKLAASIVAAVMSYEHARTGGMQVGAPTIYQVEAWTRTHTTEVEQAIKIANGTEKSDPPMTIAETGTAALAMLVGGYPYDVVEDFLGAINAGGRGKGEGSPTFVLFQLFFKAKNAANPKGRLTKTEKLALTFKGAALHVMGETCGTIKWKQSKDPLPAPTPPAVLAHAAE